MTLRVLLVEDDAAIRRFVTLALADLPITLACAASLQNANVQLTAAPPQLLLTDLMLPDGDGMALLEQIESGHFARPPGRVVVFSARVSSESRQRALALGAWRVLDKPVPLATLIDTVRQAVADLGPAGGTAAQALPTPARAERSLDPMVAMVEEQSTESPGQTRTATPALPVPTADNAAIPEASRRAAIESHFGGQAWLYDSFRDTCRQQFATDLVDADSAVATMDRPGLRRLGHSLKTVLHLLGADPAASRARSLEGAAATAGVDPLVLRSLWSSLRTAIRDLG